MRRSLCALASLLVFLLAVAGSAEEPAEDRPTISDETCTGCHPSVGESEGHALHARALRFGRYAGRTCQACHGDGTVHVAARGRPEQDDVLRFDPGEGDPDRLRRENAACAGCHVGGHLMHWTGSAHEVADVGCVACHRAAGEGSGKPGAGPLVRRTNDLETCGRCHLPQRARMRRNAHKPIVEGAMGCSSCHAPHGSLSEGMLTHASTNDTCYACHADKRGPFLWEHPPVTEDCGACHDPHGSVRGAGMLSIPQPRLCQQCHLDTLHPSEARLPGSRFVIEGACIGCHPAIHGSNHPSGFGFTR